MTMTTTTTITPNSAYDQFVTRLKAISCLKQCQSVLSYDRMVFMPKTPEAAAARGAQLSALASVIHERITDTTLFQLLEDAEKDPPSENVDAPRILELARKSIEETARIPSDLAARKADHGALAHGAWAQARESKDFSLFLPTLSTCFDIAKEEAAAKRVDESIPLYDQMLDDFEMGMTAERIEEIFSSIEKALVPLIERVRNSDTKPSTDPLKGSFDIEVQKKICRDVVESLGFDEKRGRIDEAVHPFTSSSSPSDVRITSRFSNDEWQMVSE
jgi:carboxypeptidase Taq